MVTGETGVNVYDRETTLRLAYPSVVAFDPGDLTGVCALSPGYQHLTTLNYEEMLTFCATRRAPNSTLIVERFTTRPGSFARNQVAGKVCGVLDLFASINHFKIVYQDPSVIKTMLPDLKALKAGGWSWSTPHELDAIKHAVYFLHTR